MASALAYKTPYASRTSFVARPRRTSHVQVKAFAADSSKTHLEEINTQIGVYIKQAASQVGVLRIWQANAAVGKFIKLAAEEAKAGKLKRKGTHTK